MLNSLIILGTCLAGAVLGFSVYWVIINIEKTLRANQSNSIKGERQTPLTITKDIDDSFSEKPLNEAEHAPDIRRETTEDDDWLNNGVPKTSVSTIKKEDDDWLNASVEEVPANVYKQQDDDWLNAENNQPLKTVDESSLNRAATNRPEIQIKQEGSILNITVTSSKKRDTKSEQTVINLKINVPPQDLARKGEGPYDIEITKDDSSPSYQSLQDNIAVKPVEEAVNQSPQLMDEISIRPVENQVTVSHPLMDEITVRPVESPVLVSPQLMDEISIRPVENQITVSHGLMDEISIKPSLGPISVEYELLDDLITKRAIYLTKKAKPSSDAAITNPVESPIEKEEPTKTISVNEIAEILNEKGDFKRATIPPIATELRSAPFLPRMGEGIGNLLSQATACKKMKVCIVAEGSYPVTRGGLSEWAHMLIKHLPDIEFDVFCITPTAEEKWVPVYEKLPNVGQVIIKPLIRPGSLNQTSRASKQLSEQMVELLKESFNGESMDLSELVGAQRSAPVKKGWLNSKDYFDFLTESYGKNYSEGPFSEYFWTLLGLNSIILDGMQFITELPEADIYHSLSSGFAGFAGSVAKAKWNKPLVVTEQGLYMAERRNELSRQKVSEWYRSQLIKFSESLVYTSYNSADLIVPPCLSHTAIEKEMGADPNKIQVIRNGIELDRFTPSVRKAEKTVIGCFARVVPIKGITNLIQAAKIVREKSPVEFVVLGEIQDQEYYGQCQELVKDLGLENDFKFMGHSNASEWYHKVDIFTLPSISEGVPYALLEAMSCGLPSVCTAVGGVPEIISDGVGYVVPPNRPDLLAEKLSVLVNNKELRIKMGRRAIEVANAKYNIDEMVGKFRTLYTELAMNERAEKVNKLDLELAK